MDPTMQANGCSTERSPETNHAFKALRPGEAEAVLKSRAERRKRKMHEAPEDNASVAGLALSGGGIRSATFCLGLLRGLARTRLLGRFDYLSTVSGGGYIGAMFGRLVGEARIDGAQAILARSDSRSLSWLRRYGRYLAPAGARDYGIGIATYLRAIVAVHIEFALLALVVALAAVLLHALHRSTSLYVVDGWHGWQSAWWPAAAAIWLVCAPGMLGVYWMLHDPARMESDSWKFWTRIRDAVFAMASAALGSVLLWLWLRGDSWPLPTPTWGLAAAIALLSIATIALCAAVFLLPDRKYESSEAVALVRQRLTKGLRLVNVTTLMLFLLGLLDRLSWELQEAIEKSPAGLLGGVGIGGALLLGLRALNDPVQKMLQAKGGRKVEVLPILINVIGFGTAFALLIAWTALIQWLIFHSGFGGIQVALLRWGIVAVALLVWFALVGWNVESANISSLHNMYSARLARAYLGAANPARCGGDLLGSARSTTPELLSDITEKDARDDVPIKDYDPSANGGPIHLINVCLNQTRGHKSGLYNADRKGVPLVVSAHGLEAGAKAVEGFDFARLGTLGRWVAISGAAASPGAGAYTTPGWAALLFLAGVRLGYWLRVDDASRRLASDGHPWPTGLWASVWKRLEATKMGRLRAEFRADFRGPLSPDWYLSDGGHFDNTGVHPLLQRQLDFIVLADCGADPSYRFADLENLIRKARIDYGAEIEFYTAEEADAKFASPQVLAEGELDDLLSQDVQAPQRADPISFLSPEKLADNFTARGVLVARILYAPDASGMRKQGTLLVIKPNLHLSLDSDLLAYARRNPSFPQQGTGDQFFDEAQWESYHRLGEDFGMHLTASWLHRLPGWMHAAPAVNEPDAMRVRQAKKTPDTVAADRPFWKIDAKDAAVGALSLGALLALATPVWQAFEGWRAQRVGQRIELSAAMGRIETLLETPGRRPKPSDMLLLTDFKALAQGLADESREGQAAQALLQDVYAECRKLETSPRALSAVVCEQIAPKPSTVVTYSSDSYWRSQPAGPAPKVSRPITAPAAVSDAAPAAAPTADTAASNAGPVGRSAPSASAPAVASAATDAAPSAATDAPARIEARTVAPGPRRSVDDTPRERNRIGANSRSRTFSRYVCGGTSGPGRVYVQVYDEQARASVKRLDWASLQPSLVMPGIENVAITAAAHNADPPVPHPRPTLLVHDIARDGPCAEHLRDWLRRELGPQGSEIDLRPLPKGLKRERGVIELWLPPSPAAAY